MMAASCRLKPFPRPTEGWGLALHQLWQEGREGEGDDEGEGVEMLDNRRLCNVEKVRVGTEQPSFIFEAGMIQYGGSSAACGSCLS
jgi:hypothetical protein